MATFSGIEAFPGVTSFAFVSPHSHSESSLHWMIEKIAGIVFDFSKAIDYATQWVDSEWLSYAECSPELKEYASKVKGVADRANVVFAGCATAVSAHELLDAKSPGIAEVTGFLSSTAEFIDRLDGMGAINLMEGASPVIAGIGVVSDVIGGLYGSAAVLTDDHIAESDSVGLARAKQSALYKLVKIAENVAFVALAALSGYATYCAVLAVAAPAILPFTLLAVGTAALSIKMMRCFYEGLADDGQAQSFAHLSGVRPNQQRCNPLTCNGSNDMTPRRDLGEEIEAGRGLEGVDQLRETIAELQDENFNLKLDLSKVGGVVVGLREGLESWSSHKPVQIFNVNDRKLGLDSGDVDMEESLLPPNQTSSGLNHEVRINQGA